MNTPAKITNENGRLIVKLPLTNPTGKIRIKRRSATSNYGLPIAIRQIRFSDEDYVEWQISYAIQNPPQDSIVEGIVINNNQKGFELTKLLHEGLRLDILTNNDLNELIEFIVSVGNTETLEENEEIHRISLNGEIRGFRKFEERTPLFIKDWWEQRGYFVEVILQRKQRAVGLQSMVYLCISIVNLKDNNGNSFIGRNANAKELGVIEITQTNKEIIKDVVKAFSIASQQHKGDILSILQQI